MSATLRKAAVGGMAVAMGMGMSALAVATPPPTVDPLSGWVDEAMSDAGVIGLTLVRLEQGKVAEIRAFGEVEVGGRRVTPESVFQAASLGKVAAAYAALILVHEGRLTLDQPLTDPRIDVPEGCALPTVRSALTHVSGMANDLAAHRFQPSCVPQDTFRYSGQGFLALATEMERATGRPAAEIIATLVFEPLGMADTRYGVAANGTGTARGHISWTAFAIGQAIGRPSRGVGLAVIAVLLLLLVVLPVRLGIRRGWRIGGSAWLLGAAAVTLLAAIGTRGHVRAERDLPEEWIPASLSTTAPDMGRLAAELLSPRLLPATPRSRLLEAEVRVSDCIGWSLVMGTDRCGGQPTAWQWGSNLGFQSLMVLAPDTGDGVVILTNSGGGVDAILPGQGGGPAARRVAAGLLGIDGRWDLRH